MTNDEAILVLLNDAYFLYEDDSPHDRQAYTLAVKALEAQKWIPVTERLPEKDEKVLVRCDNDYIGVWSYTDDMGNPVWEDSYGYYQDFVDVTHWIPLPEPPKESDS